MQKPMLKKPMFKMYQDVFLIRESIKGDLLCESESVIIRKGQRGQVMLICRAPGVPSIGYAVEFFDKKGETVAVSIVKEEDIAALPNGRPDIKVVKAHKNRSKARAA
jgi:hypothetical protein